MRRSRLLSAIASMLGGIAKWQCTASSTDARRRAFFLTQSRRGCRDSQRVGFVIGAEVTEVTEGTAVFVFEYWAGVALSGRSRRDFVRGLGLVAAVFGGAPLQKTYRVGATFSVGMSQYDQAYIYMPLAQAQLFLGREGSVDEIELKVKDAAAAP